MATINSPLECPCSGSTLFKACCGPYLYGQQSPPTAEALMRSRFSAYATQNYHYIEQTMRGKAAEGFVLHQVQQSLAHVQWVKLEIIHASQCTVEFKAYYRNQTACFSQTEMDYSHEKSLFQLHHKRWYYIANLEETLSRNGPCPCGSDKKFKYCCFKYCK